MPPTRRATLRLIHNRESPEKMMDRANTLLSECEAEQAVEVYSEILYKVSSVWFPSSLILTESHLANNTYVRVRSLAMIPD